LKKEEWDLVYQEGDVYETELKRSPPKGRHDTAADGRQAGLDFGALSENRI